jgi:NADH-quinone oxidoreductase subunit J
MSLTLFIFYIFSFALITSSIAVISVKNMVHSVMFLVLAFFNAAALFLLLNAEFIAILLIVVYVGAIAVLFLFVVMMLNVDIEKIKEGTKKHLPILILISVILFCEILLIVNFSSVKYYDTKILFPIDKEISSIKSIGNVLYTDFAFPFQISGMILFVAMIGAIVLTKKDELRLIKKQKISDQVLRNKANSLEIVKVKSRQGIDL